MDICLVACMALVIVALAFASTGKIRYDGYHVVSVNIENEKQRNFVKQLDASTDAVRLLETPTVQHEVKLVVAPSEFSNIEEMLSLSGLVHQLETTNLQKFIDDEQPSIIPREFGWTAYYPLETIYEWLDEKLTEYPKILTDYTVGTSYENHRIRAVKLSHKQGNPTVFIESTIHAREWITVATATYFLNELLTSKNATIVDLAQNFDWVIIPVFNVDGYTYSFSSDRLWRKNRHLESEWNGCIGVDLNRNFDVDFGGEGSSDSPCDETYHGSGPLSEPESIALMHFLENFTNIKLYLSFHSYSQLLMFPFGYTKHLTPNHEDLIRIGQKTIQAIAYRYGTLYGLGPVADVLSQATGNTIDWVYLKKNVTLAYTLEFRPFSNDDDHCGYGFILSADQIIPNSEEVIDGLVAMFAEARALKYI